MTGQHLLLLLWTLWLVVALLSVGDGLGIILVLVAGALGLGLVPTGLVSWRRYLIAALIVHIVAAAYRILAQFRPVQEAPAPGQSRPPHQGQDVLHHDPLRALSASAQRWPVSALWASAQRWPLQVLSGSVSLAGLIWLLILRPTIPWMYRADIPIMIGTVAALVAAEYGCWRLYQAYRHIDRRLAGTAALLQEERRMWRENDARNRERIEQLDDHLQLAEAETSRQQDELRLAQGDLRKAQAGIHRVQDELSRMQDELGRAHDELRQAQSELSQAQDELRQALDERAAELAAWQSEQAEPPVWYQRRGGARSRPGADLTASTGSVRVELVRMTGLSLPPDDSSGRSGALEGIATERRTVTISPQPGETVGQMTRRAETHLSREIEAAAATYTAKAIGAAPWKIVSQRWVAPDSNGLDAAAGAVAGFEADLHNILLNKPVQQLSSGSGLPGPAPAVLGGIAGAAGLPVDRPLDTVTRVIQVVGIVVSMMAGSPVVTSACFKSLIHDETIRALEAAIERTFSRQGIVRVERADNVRRPGIIPSADGLSRSPWARRAAAPTADRAAAHAEPSAAERTAADDPGDVSVRHLGPPTVPSGPPRDGPGKRDGRTGDQGDPVGPDDRGGRTAPGDRTGPADRRGRTDPGDRADSADRGGRTDPGDRTGSADRGGRTDPDDRGGRADPGIGRF